MASTLSQEPDLQTAFDTEPGEPTGPPTTPPQEGSWGTRIFVGLMILAILGGGAWGATRLIGNQNAKSAKHMLAAPVRNGELIVTVKEDGNLESASNIDIKCEVAGGTSILWIVEDGKEVEKGEKIVELDSAALEESINQQKITFEKARAAKIQAEKDFAAAKLAVDEYLQGTYVQALQDQEAQITIALENLRSAQNTLVHSDRMFRKGYISELDLTTQKFSVQRAQLDLDSARTAKDVLVKFTKIKMVQELESARDSAEAQARSEKASFDLEKSRLERLEAQMTRCLIHAPTSGMVVYANETGGRHGGGSQQPQIEEGASVRERQTILRLPDLSQMQVKVNVHESKVETLGRAWKEARDRGEELRARVRIQDRELQGVLSSIANQPEASGWWTGNIKEYATIVAIDGTPEGLRPGMTAECEILVQHLKNVLTIPVAAVVEQRGGYFAWIKKDDGTERRPLVLGATNDLVVEVKDGLVEGMEVVLNPRAMIAEARDLKDNVEEPVDVDKRFGKKVKVAPGKRRSSGPDAARRPGSRPGQGGPRGAMGSAGKGRSGNLMQFDKDGDGKISKDEVPERMQQFFDMIDGNKDGFLDKAEIAKMRSSGGGRGGGGRPGGGGGHPAP